MFSFGIKIRLFTAVKPVLRYLSNHQINYTKWDVCVEASPQRLVYALSWYLDVVAPGWAGFVMEEEGNYVAVMPLPVKHQFGIRYIEQPLFCQQLGLFSVNGALNPQTFLLEVTRCFALISKYSFNTANTPAFNPVGNLLTVHRHYTHYLDLSPDYEAIYQNYSRDRKINLKRSCQAKLEVKESTDIAPLIKLFKEDVAARIRGGVSELAYGRLGQLYKMLAAKGMATLLYTQTPSGELDAGCLFVTYGQKIIYLFNAASVAGRRRNGRSLLIDFIIKKYAGQPYVFDFESPVAVESIIRVYKGFGAVPALFYTIQYNNLPAPIKFMKKFRQFIYLKVLSNFTA